MAFKQGLTWSESLFHEEYKEGKLLKIHLMECVIAVLYIVVDTLKEFGYEEILPQIQKGMDERLRKNPFS